MRAFTLTLSPELLLPPTSLRGRQQRPYFTGGKGTNSEKEIVAQMELRTTPAFLKLNLKPVGLYTDANKSLAFNPHPSHHSCTSCTGTRPKTRRGGWYANIPHYAPEKCSTQRAGCGPGHNTQVTNTLVPPSSRVYFTDRPYQ